MADDQNMNVQPPAAPPAAPVVQPAAPRPTVQEVRKPRQDKPPENDRGIWRMSRKSFLNVAGWFAFFSFIGTATVAAIRLMVPRVLYEAPSAFKAGYDLEGSYTEHGGPRGARIPP